MLEDESGRISLVGERINSACLVTGVILGVLGVETSNGDFEVVDLCFPGMAPQHSSGLSWSPLKTSDESMDVDGGLILTLIFEPPELTYVHKPTLQTVSQMSG